MVVVSISRKVSIKQFQIYASYQADISHILLLFFFGPFRCEIQGAKNESQQRENSVHLQFFFHKGENASQAAEIVNGGYGAVTVTTNYVQFWFRQFRSGIFDALRTGRTVVKNVDKITEIIEIDRHVSSRSIAQELKIDHKTVLNHLRKVGF
ncbi:histone-lysine N-methyltransferase SETMAR [Trichonephila clavipes]|nr:histone-lysine N-methyltransferase SETMAR [Trichonephila clavipes]